MKYFSYLNTAATITALYKGQQPFHLFIKDFFRQHKKYGSSDRKQITHLCYCYFRLGASLQHLPATEKIQLALFFCSVEPSAMLAALNPEWNEKVRLSIAEKCHLLQLSPSALLVFPAPDEISSTIAQQDFIFSHFIQPDVFLRIRPGQQAAVITKLENAQLAYSFAAENCLRLSANSKTDGIIDINREAVVQDYSSQRTGQLLSLVQPLPQPVKIWDCCTASGGKSIMAKDLLHSIDLTVSDIRESVLINLKKRFQEAGITKYKIQLANLAAAPSGTMPRDFDLIIADVPCTGSGTWGRNPERLSFFNKKEIDTYNQLQQKILTAILPSLKKDGFLLYITCSVFKKENEAIVDFIRENFPVELVKMEVLEGYPQKADTLFAALLRKSM